MRPTVARPARLLPLLAVAAAAAAALLASRPAAADWYVACDLATGAVVLDEADAREGRERLAGPFPGKRTAETWVTESCPSLRCAKGKGCVAAAAEGGGGWVAGEVTSVTLSGGGTATSPPSRHAETPPPGPPSADLSPVVETAKAAAAACSFEAAKTAAEQIKLFDPADPWLVANLPKLERLAERQRTTEQTVWAANAALSSGDLKRARKLAATAADNAVACQSQAVAELVRGIDAAITAQKEARQAENRRAAAALLPGLVDLSRALSGAAAGSVPLPAGGGPAPAYGGVPAAALGTADPCAFKFVYESKWSVEPVCSCPGYRFDGRQFRCAR